MVKEYEFKNRVMGTDFIVSLVSTSPEAAQSGYYQALGIARAYESRFSRFLKSSELSRLNEDKDLVVSEIFWEVFGIAENLYKETKAIFNPLLQVAHMGYDRDFDSMNKNIQYTGGVCYDVNWSSISADKSAKRICLGPDQRLDFGGFLKGYVAEEIANTPKYNFTGIIINIGGDIFTHGEDEHGKPFTFSAWNPVTQKEFGHILVKNEAVATSGTYKRKWNVDGKEVFHILDSNNLQSSETDIVSATVVAPHGSLAEAYATVAICLGLDGARKLLDKKHFRYVLIDKNGWVHKNI